MADSVGSNASTSKDMASLILRGVPNLDNASFREVAALADVPVFLGYMFSFLLQGILVVQVFLYFRRTDPLYVKITVFVIFFTETLSILFAVTVMVMSIIQIGDLANSINLWGFKIVALLCGSTIVYAFYSWRIRILKGSWWLVVATMVLSVLQCVMVAISGFGVLHVALLAGDESSFDFGAIAIILWLTANALYVS